MAKEERNLVDFAINTALESIETNISIEAWAKSVGISLYSNQVEIMRALADPFVKNLVILAARSSGKTYAVAAGIIKACLDGGKGSDCIIFGPRAGQAQRILKDEIYPMLRNSPFLSKEVLWDGGSNASQVVFRNGANIWALSGDESSQVEGYHAPFIVVDEAHQVTDTIMRQRIQPMVRGFANPKIVKIGISLHNNHFRQSANNPRTTKLVFPWYKCPKLYSGELITINGEKFPKDIIDAMPLSYKKARWPFNKELHFESVEGLSEEDFDTQYEMKWVDSISPFFSSDDMFKMQGTHDLLMKGIPHEDYYFGVDTAGGDLIRKDENRDDTQVAIVRKTAKNVKELVAILEIDSKDAPSQTRDVLDVITKLFLCSFGAADYSNVAIGMVDEFIQNFIPIAGIKYNATYPVNGKNYKNAIFEHFQYEVRNDRFKLPQLTNITEYPNLMKTYHQLEVLEKKLKAKGINATIQAPLGEHDDCPNAVALALWAADKCEDEKAKFSGTFKYTFPRLNIGKTTQQSRSDFASSSSLPSFFPKRC